MSQSLHRLPTVFKPKKKPLPEPSDEGEDLEGRVEEAEVELPTNSTYSGVNMRGYINDVIKDIKALEKLRKRKYGSREFAQREREIKQLSERVQTYLDDIVSQVPLGITPDAIYEVPDQKEIDGLLRSRKEYWAEIKAGTMGFLIGGVMIGGMATSITYCGLREIAGETARHISYAIAVIEVAVAALSGRDMGRDIADHRESLKYPSDKRRDNAKARLNLLYEVYIKGGFDSRVQARVEELRQARANENTAIITHAKRAQVNDHTAYERLFAARVAHELGMTTSDPSARVFYMDNVAQLRGLEKSIGLPLTPVDFPSLIAAGERQFEEAKSDRDYTLMRRTAHAVRTVVETYTSEPGLSDEKKEQLSGVSYSWGGFDYGVSGDCTKMERWARKAKKAKTPKRVKKFEDKIEAKYTPMQAPHYVPVD